MSTNPVFDALTINGASILNGGVFNGTFSGAPTLSWTPTWSGLQTFSGGAAITGGSLSGTFTGNPTLSGIPTFSGGGLTIGTGAGTAPNANMVSAAGNTRLIRWFTGGTGGSNLRWQVGATSDAESGSNAGTNWVITAISDTGVNLGEALRVTRSTLGAAFAGTIRTPFLNMGGVTGTGLNTTISSSTGIPFSQSPLWVNYFFTGTNTGPNEQNFNTIIVNDNVVYNGGGQSNAVLIQQNVQDNATRAGGLWCRVQQTAAPTSPFGFLTALTASGQISYNCGGTDFTALTNTVGSVNTFNTYSELASGATFIAGLKGYELDIHARTGSSVGVKTGILIARLSTDAVAGAFNIDTALSFTGTGPVAGVGGPAVGWDYCIGFGAPNSQLPYKTTATFIKAFQPQTPSTGQALAACGIDFYGVTFSGNAFQSAGYSVDGSGNVIAQAAQLGGFSLTPSGSTLTVAQAGRASTVSGIAAGGSGYSVGDKVTTANGGLFRIDSLSGTVVTGVTQLVPAYAASPPSNPVATVYTNQEPGSGTLFHSIGVGLTLNLTWSAAGGLLSLGGASDNVQFNAGSFTANASTAVSLTAVAPAGAHATVQEWLTIKNASGTVRYIPCF